MHSLPSLPFSGEATPGAGDAACPVARFDIIDNKLAGAAAIVGVVHACYAEIDVAERPERADLDTALEHVQRRLNEAAATVDAEGQIWPHPVGDVGSLIFEANALIGILTSTNAAGPSAPNLSDKLMCNYLWAALTCIDEARALMTREWAMRAAGGRVQ